MTAPAYDTSTVDTDSSGRSSASFSHTCTGTDLVLLVFICAQNGSTEPTVSAITYGGDAMTLVASATSQYDTAPPADRFVKVFCYKLTDPSTGSNTLSVTYGETQTSDSIIAVSYSGAHDVGASSTAYDDTGPFSDPSDSVPTTYTDAVVVGGFANKGGDTNPYTEGSGVTERQDGDTGSHQNTDISYFLGERGATSIASYTINATTGGNNDAWAGVVVEVYEPQGGEALVKAVADTLAFTDDDVSARTMARVYADTVALADANEYTKGIVKAIADTLALTEANEYTKGIVKAISDTVALTEAVQRRMAMVRTQADTVAITEGILRPRALARLVADTLALSEAVVHPRVMVRILNNTVALTQDVLRSWTRSLADTLTITDAEEHRKTILAIITDTLAIQEAVSDIRGLVRAIAATLALTEATEADTFTYPGIPADTSVQVDLSAKYVQADVTGHTLQVDFSQKTIQADMIEHTIRASMTKKTVTAS